MREYIRTDNSFKELAINLSEIQKQQPKTVKAFKVQKERMDNNLLRIKRIAVVVLKNC